MSSHVLLLFVYVNVYNNQWCLYAIAAYMIRRQTCTLPCFICQQNIFVTEVIELWVCIAVSGAAIELCGWTYYIYIYIYIGGHNLS